MRVTAGSPSQHGLPGNHGTIGCNVAVHIAQWHGVELETMSNGKIVCATQVCHTGAGHTGEPVCETSNEDTATATYFPLESPSTNDAAP